MSGKATQRSELRMPSLKVHPHFGALLGCSAEAQKNWQAQSLVLKSSLEPDQGFLSLLQAGCSVPWLKAMWMVSGRLSPSASRQHRQLSLLKIGRSFHSCVWLTLVLRSSRSIFTTDSCLHRTLCSLILREGANQSLNQRWHSSIAGVTRWKLVRSRANCTSPNLRSYHRSQVCVFHRSSDRTYVCFVNLRLLRSVSVIHWRTVWPVLIIRFNL